MIDIKLDGNKFPQVSMNTTPSAPEDVPITSYIILSNKRDEVLKSFTDYKQACKFLNLLRRAGADVSLFKELQA